MIVPLRLDRMATRASGKLMPATSSTATTSRPVRPLPPKQWMSTVFFSTRILRKISSALSTTLVISVKDGSHLSRHAREPSHSMPAASV
eukprot:CAMPEP_0205909498 /NCGR_PEP_ID=MMETSP1325-20131115/3912_1 /ASSEMBLY_ACC=CAM_ASM_000708 /TAXON_ID=236786 /ORGANISM="Florenciella sp., Strain RCC1007" /LENGTH=88 /DNA_ID=CAMNT_0053275789 /DNA_START=45 /DNA_END=308 /DNA_ORIENTATION=-